MRHVWLVSGAEFPYISTVQTVVETPPFLASAKEAGVPEELRSTIVSLLASDPEVGVEMRWTGGCRKARFAGRGKGKSGGYRVVYFYTGPGIPIFLLTVFGKGEKDNLTREEANALANLSKRLIENYRRKAAGQERNR